MNVFEERVEQAALDCVEFGQATGRERAVVLARDGRTLFSKLGSQHYVEFREEELERFAGGKILVHNHPSPCSLSVPDMLSSDDMKMDCLAATRDGGRYFFYGFKEAPFGPAWNEFNEITGRTILQGITLADRYGLPKEQGAMLQSHLRNWQMAKEGLLTYKFIPGSELVELLQRVKLTQYIKEV